MEELDLVILGAERLYDGLVTNNLYGTFEFSDFPMEDENLGAHFEKHIPAITVHKYLTAYAEHFGLLEKVRLGAKVVAAELTDENSWIISFEVKDVIAELKVFTKKMIVATGPTSTPHLPSMSGRKDFIGHVFHSGELPRRTKELKYAKKVVVVGGNKSAADAVYMNASSGKHVDWVIRSSGCGPCWIAWPRILIFNKFNVLLEQMDMLRPISFLGPAFDHDAYPTIRHLLHNTKIGRRFVRAFYSFFDKKMVKVGGYNDHEETKKLIPRSSLFWSGTSVGLFNHPEHIFALAKKGLIHVHNKDITSLGGHRVHLADGTYLEADVIICATGWDRNITLKVTPDSMSEQVLGLSSAVSSDLQVKVADAEIKRRYPGLIAQPAASLAKAQERKQVSYALYRGAIPPSLITARNIAYQGMGSSNRATLVAEIQALWITAYLDGKLSVELPDSKEAEWQALLQSRFYRWRSPNGMGFKGVDLVLELLPFIDTLLRDLGLNPSRKGGLREFYELYSKADYKGIVQEWIKKEYPSG